MKKIGLRIAGFVLLAATAAAQSLTVTAPNGGESWPLGTPRSITWNSSGASGAVRIVLFKGSVKIGNIAEGIPAASGSYSWTVGQWESGTVQPGADYKVRVRNSEGTLDDFSDNAFTIAAALPPPPPPLSLRVTAPNGGGTWKLGSTLAISWSSTNLYGNVNLELVRVPDQFVGWIGKELHLSGSLDWKVGELQDGTRVDPGKYLVRVRWAQQPKRFDDCDEPIQLISPLMEKVKDLGALRGLTLTVPAKVDSYYANKIPNGYSGGQFQPSSVWTSRPSCDGDQGRRVRVGCDWFFWPGMNQVLFGRLLRGKLTFDLGEYQGRGGDLKSAKLHLQQLDSLVSNTTWKSCAIGLSALLAPMTAFEGIQVENIGGCLYTNGDYRLDVTGVVRRWLDGSLANHGLLLVGREMATGGKEWICFSCFKATLELDF